MITNIRYQDNKGVIICENFGLTPGSYVVENLRLQDLEIEQKLLFARQLLLKPGDPRLEKVNETADLLARIIDTKCKEGGK